MTAGARQRTHERAGLALEVVWRPCGGHLVTRGSFLPLQTLESLHNRKQKDTRQNGWTWSRRPLCSFLADDDRLLEAAQKQTWAPGLDWSPSLSWGQRETSKDKPSGAPTFLAFPGARFRSWPKRAEPGKPGTSGPTTL